MATKKKSGRPATKAKPAKAKPVRTVIVQNWEESDSWSGPSDDGFTLHLSTEAHKAFVAAFCRDQRRRLGEATPEAYTRVDGEPKLLPVNEKIYKKLLRYKDKNGLWGNGNRSPAHLLDAKHDVNAPSADLR